MGKILAWTAAAILIPGGFYFLAVSGPKRVSPDAPYSVMEKREPTREEQARIAELNADEAEFEKLAVLRQPTREDLEILERVIRGYTELEAVLPGKAWAVRDHIAELNRRKQEYWGNLLYADSRALEAEARLQEANGDLEAARFSFRRAYNVQLEINTDYAGSTHYNPGRAMQLARRVRFLEAEPTYRNSVRIEQEARFAENHKDFVAARQLMQQALVLQETINNDFPDAPQSDLIRANRLRRQMRSLQSAEMHGNIQQAVEWGRSLEANEQYLEAAEYYRKARIMQKGLNDRFPGSRYASTQKLVEYETIHQLTLSRERILEIQDKRREVAALLRRRDVYNAVDSIEALLPVVRDLLETVPSSRDPLRSIEAELTYLDLLGESMSPIQETIFGNCRPLPGSDAWLLFSTEVSQQLYRMIMGTNPSPERDDPLPVHGVTAEEAGLFCQRLGWILGLEVRLPTVREMENALGSIRYVTLEAHYFSAENADGRLHPVDALEPNATGFHHLLGNVSEWALGPVEEAAPMIAGGGRLHEFSDLIAFPRETRETNRRWPDVGFRFVVARPEVPESEPVAAAGRPSGGLGPQD